MARCLLGLGSNLGDRQTMLRRATGSVGRLSGCQLLAQSRWHETTPIGGPTGQGAFLNGALLLDCTIPAEDLARELQTIEAQLGRNRAIRWDARAIDIDLLLFADEVIESPSLSVPHPRMSFRKFVLEPAAEIAGFMVDPITGWTLSRLLSHLTEAPRYVAVASADAAIAAWLAEGLCQALGCLRLEPLPRAGNAATRRVQKESGDSEASTAVEFSQRASAKRCSSRWENDKELAKRLAPACGESREGVPPVVSAFGYDELAPERWFPADNTSLRKFPEEDLSADASTFYPALVITVEPSSQENFRKKTGIKKRKKTGAFSPPRTFRESSKHQGRGPRARIRADDPEIVLQEAVAAIRSVWPELPALSVE